MSPDKFLSPRVILYRFLFIFLFIIFYYYLFYRWGGEYDGVLPNLTHFSLAHNKLYDIPAELIARFPALATLDLTGNQFIHYYPVFTQGIKSGLDLRYCHSVISD